MNKVFVISDLHFGHNNMAIRRGFSSIKLHDDFIIESWNKVVSNNDTVYILGDITHEKSAYYTQLDKLKGVKKVVLGNHDLSRHVPELLKHVNSVCGMVLYKGFILTHCPISKTQFGRYKYNVHGHIHQNIIEDYCYINVSCEAINYTPILFTELIKFNNKKIKHLKSFSYKIKSFFNLIDIKRSDRNWKWFK